MADSIQVQFRAYLDEKEINPKLGESITYGSSALLNSQMIVHIPASTSNLNVAVDVSGDIQNMRFTVPPEAEDDVTVKINNSANHEFKIAPIFEVQGLTASTPINLYFTNTSTALQSVNIEIQGV